ncbi:protein CpxP [Oxalobacteraceae bacterium GrIS 2.11]
MKKIGKQLGKQIAIGFIAFGFVSASALVSAQETITRSCQEQTKQVEFVQANFVKDKIELREQLGLTAAQEPAWSDFISSVPVPTKPSRIDRAAMDKLTTPERLEQQLNQLREQEAKITSNLLALKTFYASLTPEQQKTFDEYHAKIARNKHSS